MNKYRVVASVDCSFIATIEAENEDEAERIVENFDMNDVWKAANNITIDVWDVEASDE